MISHKHKCIYVHIPKAAGTSIETVFIKDLELDFEDKHALILGKTTNLYAQPKVLSHLTAEQYVSQHYLSQELFEEYFKFSFTRHPVNRLFSTYKYLGFESVIDFDTFIKMRLEGLYESKSNFFFKTQTEYLYSSDNRVLVDYLGKFENLNSDFEEVLTLLGMNHCKLGHANKGEKPGYLRGFKKIIENPSMALKLNLSTKKKKKLSGRAKEIIEKIYHEDFSNFDYKL